MMIVLPTLLKRAITASPSCACAPRRLFPDAIAAARPGEAGQVTYAIQNYPADQQGATLSGMITTDGLIGNLAGTDIVSWSWTITPVGGRTFTVSSTDAGAELNIEGSLVASPSSITMAAAPPAGANDFALLNGSFDLEYERIQEPGQSPFIQYLGAMPGDVIWGTQFPAMGGTDPWLIATAGSAVPEPSCAMLMSLGFAGALLCRTLLQSNRIQLRELPYGTSAASRSLS
jgi:hypothetical protein